jgi:hypothetical protein
MAGREEGGEAVLSTGSAHVATRSALRHEGSEVEQFSLDSFVVQLVEKNRLGSGPLSLLATSLQCRQSGGWVTGKQD